MITNYIKLSETDIEMYLNDIFSIENNSNGWTYFKCLSDIGSDALKELKQGQITKENLKKLNDCIRAYS